MRRFAGVGRTAKVKSGGFGPKTYFVSFCAGFFTATLENEAPSTRYGGEGNGCRRGGETVETRDERRVPESPTEYTLLLCASERGGEEREERKPAVTPINRADRNARSRAKE